MQNTIIFGLTAILIQEEKRREATKKWARGVISDLLCSSKIYVINLKRTKTFKVYHNHPNAFIYSKFIEKAK